MERNWNKFQQDYPVGKQVRGIIVRKMPFGVFVDINEPFMALLEIIEMKELEYKRYTKDLQFNVGEVIHGYVLDCAIHNQQLRITQKQESE